MITTMYTIGVMLVMLGVFVGIEMIRQLVKTGELAWMFMIMLVVSLLAVGLAMALDEPRNDDVLKGKAHYNKVVTYDGDKETVTYKIEWNDKARH